MTENLRSLFSMLIVSVLLYACGSAKKLFEQGDYYEAVIKSADKLRSKPDHKKTREALKQAYPLAVEELLDQIRRVKASNPEFQNSEAVYSYDRLNHMYEEIRRSPGARKVISNPASYYDELGKVKLAAAEEQYQAGTKELQAGRRENGKRAYGFFRRANQMIPNYKDATAKMDQAYAMAILKVFVDIKPVNSQQYQLSSDFFYDQVKLIFREIEQNDFIRFYTPQEAQRLKLDRPHQILTMNFVDFKVGETHQLQRVEKVERDSVIVGSVKLDNGTTKDVYNTVSAKLTINRMEVISNGLMRLEIRDEYSSTTLKKDDLGGEYVWFNEWGNFNGDERALTSEQIYITKNQQALPPPAQDLFIEFTRPIYVQTRAHLIGFYRGY